MLFFRVRGYFIVLTKMKAMSLCLLKHVVNAIFLKHSKEGRLSSGHVAIRNVLSDVCYDVTKHYQVQSEHRRTHNPFQHLRGSVFPQTVKTLNSLTGYAKKLLLRRWKGFWICLFCKTSVRCAKRTLDVATWNINLRDVCFEIFQWY